MKSKVKIALLSVLSMVAVAILLSVNISQNALNASPANPNAIVCSEQLAQQAVENYGPTAKCIEKGKEAHPGFVIGWSITSTSGCSNSYIRGCTYQITVYADCGNPLCLSPTYLILNATVDCMFNVVSYTCYN